MSKVKQIELLSKKDELADIFADITNELHHAEAKFPTWPNDPVYAAANVAEEAGELVKAVLDQYYFPMDAANDAKTEAIQTAVTAIRFLIFMNHTAEGETKND